MKTTYSAKLMLLLALVLLTSLACRTVMGQFEGQDSPLEPTAVRANTPQPQATATSANSPGSNQDNPTPSASNAGPNTTITVPGDIETTFAPYWEVWDIIHKQYVDQPIDNTAMILGGIAGLQGITSTVGLDMPAITLERSALESYARAAGTPDELVADFLPFWETWVLVEAPKDVQLMRAAIKGSLQALNDQHTSYMDPNDFFQATSRLEGDYEGIGAWVDPDGEYLTIVSPMPGSPAEEAGLQPGDEIIKIDGEDMTGIDGNLVIRKVLGPAGSQVVLSVRREGQDGLLDFTITRGRIIIPSVDGKMLDGGIAYIQLFQFADKTRDDLRQYLTDLLAQNPQGLILDLRNNGGGYLNTAIEVASEFISEGPILYEVYGDGERDTFNALRGGLALDIPVVVLVNEGSASASEIVAGAIQDYERGMLVGATTFGKGSVQSWIPLRSEDGAVRVTIARWYTPKERLIHEVGLEPDVQVELTIEDIEADRDPQLEKAIEILSQGQ